MSQIIPINIPTYISDQNYNPSRVLPRLFYYNGLINCETYYIESGSLTQSGVTYAQTAFPYFDNYNVVTGSFPTVGSKSLLFNNEAVAYGSLPSSSLFTEYWDNYVSLLYNPKTRLLTAKAIIPLADYVKMELNDIVNFRGNYYHLRSINNYSLKTGDCELQLLGPIIPDTFSRLQPTPEPPPSGAFAEVSWSFTETNGANGNFKIYRNGSPVVTATSTTTGNLRVSGSDVINPELYPVSWTAGTSMSLNVNGGATISTSATTDTILTASFTAQTGSIYYVTGSIIFNSVSGCCTPTITTASLNGANLEIFFTTGSGGCDACTATTIQSSADNITFGGNNTGGCTSPRSITAPTASTYYRMQVVCASTTSSFSTSYYYVSASAPSTATLYWSFSELGGGQGIYDLYINAVSVETRNNTANGTYTVNVGDVITVGCNADQCTGGGSTYTNIEVSGEITDAACQNNGSIPSYVSPGYTVVSGDVGTNLYVDLQVSCQSACL